MLDAKWLLGNVLSIAVTAMITVSNKDLLSNKGPFHVAGPAKLLVLHRLMSALFWTSTYWCSGRPPNSPHVPRGTLITISLMSNLSIVASFLVLREASVAFHQLSRLMILPMSAAVDLLLYGKRRTVLEYCSIILISYGLVIGLSGEITATPRAAFYAVFCALTTLINSATAGHLMRSSGVGAREVVVKTIPYEIINAGMIAIVFHLVGTETAAQAASAATESLDRAALLRVGLNAVLAVSVVFLTTWTQGASSNMLYAILGQAKTLTTVALAAYVFETALSIRTKEGLAIAVSVAIGVAISEEKTEPSKEPAAEQQQHGLLQRKRRIASALCFGIAVALIAGDATAYGLPEIVGKTVAPPPPPQSIPQRVAAQRAHHLAAHRDATATNLKKQHAAHKPFHINTTAARKPAAHKLFHGNTTAPHKPAAHKSHGNTTTGRTHILNIKHGGGQKEKLPSLGRSLAEALESSL